MNNYIKTLLALTFMNGIINKQKPKFEKTQLNIVVKITHYLEDKRWYKKSNFMQTSKTYLILFLYRYE